MSWKEALRPPPQPRRISYANVAATLALVLSLGGGAYAAASSFVFIGPGGKIKGCVEKSKTLEIVRPSLGCPKGTQSLVFNQAGERGAPGTPGTNGASGPTGSSGTNGNNGAVAGLSATQQSGIFLSGTLNTLVSKAFPAGSYIITAKAGWSASGGPSGYAVSVSCELFSGSNQLDVSQSAVSATGSNPASGVLPLEAAVNITALSVVSVQCFVPTGTATATTGLNATITAVQTSSNS